MAIICTVLALGQALLTMRTTETAHTTEGSADGLGPLRVIVFLGPLAVACGTAYTILTSGGRKSVGGLNGTSILLIFVTGFLGAGRQAMALAFVTYYLTCFAYRFKFRASHIAILIAMLCAAQFILFPYALYARQALRRVNRQNRFVVAFNLLQDVLNDPLRYQQGEQKRAAKLSSSAKRLLYFGRPMASLDRYSIIITADGVVRSTLNQGTLGTETIEPGFLMLLPRIINAEKPNSSVTNRLAHRVPGLIGKNDMVTGVTLGFVCDAFSSFGWWGACVIPFLILFSLITLYRLLFNDRFYGNVIPLAFALKFPWFFSEGIIATSVLTAFQGPVIIVVTLGFVRWLTNLLAEIKPYEAEAW